MGDISSCFGEKNKKSPRKQLKKANSGQSGKDSTECSGIYNNNKL